MSVPTVIHDTANDWWQIVLPDGKLLTWQHEIWATPVSLVGADTITQDEQGNGLTTVCFPNQIEAELGIEIMGFYRNFLEEIRDVKEEYRGRKGEQE